MVDLNEIRSWAEEAVRMARETSGITLDYSRKSIALLERALDGLRDSSRDDDDTWDLACRFGAYFGETMLRNDLEALSYKWGEDYDGEPCLITSKPQDGASLDKILPITKVNKYLLSGPSESVARLYAMCLSHLKGGDLASNLSKLGVDSSSMPGTEPSYVNAGRFDANAAAWLLYGDYVFFQAGEIAWDGTTHSIRGLQINAAKMNEIPVLLANRDVLNGFVDLLTELEKDEDLRVPLAMIHPGLRDAVRDEDLTGITLFNLMAQAQALIVKETSPDTYAVMCDVRLPMGIPGFYQLVARMIWDMRAYNDRSGAFKVGFANARNFDADAVLGEVDEMVPGAFSQPIYELAVAKKPQVQLPSDEDARAFEQEMSHVFASGFDDPMDVQADEGLFVAALNQLARECPITQNIEGTHHMGRIPRIEHVRVGDPLVLAADWQSEWFDPVCIEVFNTAGETLGNLTTRFTPTLSGNRELACLLPHVTATVETVTPKSKRRRNAKYALMDVRMELDPAVKGPDGSLLPWVIEDAKALLEQPKGERVVLSKGGLVASQLKGSIDVSEAHDVPNPLGGTFRLWEVGTDDEAAEEPEAEAPRAAAVTQEKPQQAFDTGRWTFDRHQSVKGRRFSIEVPDQWEPGNDESGRVLGQYVQGIEEDTEYPQILYSSIAADLDDESVELWRSTSIPETHLQMRRKALYSNDLANKMARVVNDWIVEGKNCQVVVFEGRLPSLFPDMFPDSYEYHVNPIAYEHGDFLRLTDTSGHLGEGELRALAFAVAATIELDRPMELRRLEELETYCEGPADADAFCETVGVIAQLLNMSGSDRMNANLYRAVRRADNDMKVMLLGDTMPLIQAESFNESLYDEISYFGLFVRVLEKQAELGTDGFDRMWKLVGEFGDGRIVDHIVMSDNKESEARINALGVIKIPEEYQALHKRWEALKPGPDGRPGRPRRTAAVSAATVEPRMGRAAQRRAERKAQEDSTRSIPCAAQQMKSVDFADRVLSGEYQLPAIVEPEKPAEVQAPVQRHPRTMPHRSQAQEEKRRKAAKERQEANAGAVAEAVARYEKSADFADSILDARREGKDPRAESEGIAPKDTAREERYEQLRASQREGSTREYESSRSASEQSSEGGKSTSSDQPVQEKKGSLGKTLLILAVLAIMAAVVVFYTREQTSKRRKEVYENATALFESQDYAEAAAAFKTIEDYEDSAVLAQKATQEAREEAFGQIKPGMTITLGSYEQDNDTSNGPEPIEWIVLAVGDDRALLLSYYGLDARRYNDSVKKNNAWEQCSLKEWLANEFKTAAFSEGERTAYLVGAPFCLSAEEVEKYLLSKYAVSSAINCTITPYAAAQENSGRSKAGDTGVWWLRQDVSSDELTAMFAPVIIVGRVRNNMEVNKVQFVRPAVYVYLK